jgi:elongation factor P
MITPGELRKGATIELDDQLWNIVDYEHIKIGRGGATVRLRLRNVRSGATVERTFPASAKFRRVFMDRRPVQFLYREDDTFYFMDTENFNQVALGADQLGDDANYLVENMQLELLVHEDTPVAVELPPSVELRVVDTEPGVRGDTAAGGTKPAVMETGLKVQVPLFVNVGDLLRIDTRTGAYLERAG